MQFHALRANAGGRIGLLVVTALVVLGNWFVLGGILGQALATGHPTTPAVITRSHLVERKGSKGGRTYSLALAYEYVVDGRRYTGTRRRYYEMGTADRRFWEGVQVDFPVGRVVPVSYSPSDPADAILSPGVQPTDWVRALVVFPLTVLAIGGWRLVTSPRPEFDPLDPVFVAETDTGWEARLPERSHLRVFLVVGCGLAALGGLVLSAANGMAAQPELIGAVIAGSVAAGAAAAAVVARYPVLVADRETGELVLPEGWVGGPVRVPFANISDVVVRAEERSAGRAGKYEVYSCVLAWADDDRPQLTTLATYVKRWSAEGLAEWVKLATGRVPAGRVGSADGTGWGRTEATPADR